MLYLNTDFAGPQVRDVCAQEGTEAIVFDEEFAGVVADAEAPLGRFVAWHEGDVEETTLKELIRRDETPGSPRRRRKAPP